MGELLNFATGMPLRAAGSTPSIDMLTVEVAVAIWRLGGRADGAAIAQAVAQGRGRSVGFTPTERLALEQAIENSVRARAERGLEALLRSTAGEATTGWALTPLARRILGDRG